MQSASDIMQSASEIMHLYTYHHDNHTVQPDEAVQYTSPDQILPQDSDRSI